MEELSKKWHQKDATSLVVKLGKSSQWTEVLQLVALAREPDSIFLSAAISACGQARRWKAALAVFRCGKKDVLTCDAAMSVCEKSNQWQHVMQLFDEMTSTNIQKSLRTFTTTIKACKMWTAAIEYLQQLRQSSLQPDILLYTVLLNTIASDSKWEVAVATLDDMTRNALRADSFIYGAVIKSCDAGQWATALHFLQESPWDLLTFNAGLNVCAKAGQWQMCLDVFDSMQQTDVVSYSICISSFEKSSQWQHAVGLLQDMLQSRVEPNEVSFNAAISAQSNTEIALGLFQDMELLQVQRSIVTFNAALNACDKGQWQEATYLLQKLEEDGLDMDPITFSAMLTACESAWTMSLQLLESYLAKKHIPHGLHAGSVLKAMSSSRCWHSALSLLQELRRIWEQKGDGKTETLPDFKTWHEFLPESKESLNTLTISTQIIYREGDFMAVSKPAGVSTEQTLQTLADQLSTCIFSISRLDLPTSGILPVVLGQESTVSARWFLSQFAGTLVSKEYICLCNGKVEPSSGQIDLPLRIEATSSSTSRAVVEENVASALSACTDYEVLAILQPNDKNDSSPDLSLVKAWPRTGRLHQIRAHLAAKGFPLVGDLIYASGSGRSTPIFPWCKRLFLHCHSVRVFGFHGPIQLKAELPEELNDALGALKIHEEVTGAMRAAMSGVIEKLEAERALNALVRCQEERMPDILKELDRGKKESHWAWYIFPTTREGKNDPNKTYVTDETAVELCDKPTAKDWQKCLEKICDLLEICNKRPPDDHVLPPDDHNRVYYFIQFWQNYCKSPKWLLHVCQRLQDLQFKDPDL